MDCLQVCRSARVRTLKKSDVSHLPTKRMSSCCPASVLLRTSPCTFLFPFTSTTLQKSLLQVDLVNGHVKSKPLSRILTCIFPIWELSPPPQKSNKQYGGTTWPRHSTTFTGQGLPAHRRLQISSARFITIALEHLFVHRCTPY